MGGRGSTHYVPAVGFLVCAVAGVGELAPPVPGTSVCVCPVSVTLSAPALFAVISSSQVVASVTCSVPVIVVLPSILTTSDTLLISTSPALLILIVVPLECVILIRLLFGVLSYSIR